MNKDFFKMLQPFLLLGLSRFTKRSSACRDESLERDFLLAWHHFIRRKLPWVSLQYCRHTLIISS